VAAYAYRLPRRKFRYRGRNTTRDRAIGVGIAVVLIGAAGKTAAPHGHASPARTTAIVIPSGGSLDTRAEWAGAFLAADSLPETTCNLSAVIAWETREGGGFGNQAAYNPLNVNPGPGAGWPGYPAIGAWAFPDAATGLRYTVATLDNGDYGGILSALRAGNSAQAVCDAIMASPWAASRYDGTLTASC
jgi:hypothetical protein